MNRGQSHQVKVSPPLGETRFSYSVGVDGYVLSQHLRPRRPSGVVNKRAQYVHQ